MLSAALERAKPGDLILVIGIGDGADAILLRATDLVARFRPKVGVGRADRAQAHAAVGTASICASAAW